MMYERARIYVMSGTGNSLRAASWIAESLREGGRPAQLAPIEGGVLPKGTLERGRELLGVVSPTHGFTAPWPMIRFVFGLPSGGGTRAFVVLTRAGLKFGPVYTPGMEGTGAYLLALLLLLKGYDVRAVMGLDMPSNWTSLHSGLAPASVEAIIDRARRKTARFVEACGGGSRCFSWGGVLQLVFGLLLLPLSVGYLLFGKFFLAKLFFANPSCNGCGVCAELCPNRAIRMWGREDPRPYWTFSCESCMRCMGYCPHRAVEAGHSLGLLFYFVTTVPVGVFVLNALGRSLPGMAQLSTTRVSWLIQYPYALLSLYASYLLFTALIRIPFLNRLFTWTTLTRFYRRYREPETGLKQLRQWESARKTPR